MYGTVNSFGSLLRVYEDETRNIKRQAAYAGNSGNFWQLLNNEWCPRKANGAESDLVHPLEIYGIDLAAYVAGDVVVSCSNGRFAHRKNSWSQIP